MGLGLCCLMSARVAHLLASALLAELAAFLYFFSRILIHVC